MNVDLTRFRTILEEASFSEYGDPLEQEHGHLISESFPTCEQFWRCFVVPLTSRIESYPESLTKMTSFRPTVADEVREISAAHYSMFSHLVSAHYHLHHRQQCWFEDAYMHLFAVCDLAELVLERWYLLSLRCSDQPSRVLQLLGRDEFLEKAGQWYDEHYASFYTNYLSRGKFARIEVISRDEILTEYLGKKSDVRRAYKSHANLIRPYRNIIVHKIKFGSIQVLGGDTLVPKAQSILSYPTWADVESAAQDHVQIERDFEDPEINLSQALLNLEVVLDGMWEVLMQDFIGKFFIEDHTPLHELFDLSFRQEGSTVLLNDQEPSPPHAVESPPSGTITAGSALFPPSKRTR